MAEVIDYRREKPKDREVITKVSIFQSYLNIHYSSGKQDMIDIRNPIPPHDNVCPHCHEELEWTDGDGGIVMICPNRCEEKNEKSMKVNCPNCQKTIENYEVAMLNDVMGYEFNCPRCKTIIHIPEGEARMTTESEHNKVINLRRFFIEHPIHKFSFVQIAKYFDIDLISIKPMLKRLEDEGFLEKIAEKGVCYWHLKKNKIKKCPSCQSTDIKLIFGKTINREYCNGCGTYIDGAGKMEVEENE